MNDYKSRRNTHQLCSTCPLSSSNDWCPATAKPKYDSLCPRFTMGNLVSRLNAWLHNTPVQNNTNNVTVVRSRTSAMVRRQDAVVSCWSSQFDCLSVSPSVNLSPSPVRRSNFNVSVRRPLKRPGRPSEVQTFSCRVKANRSEFVVQQHYVRIIGVRGSL